jgi:hypothetical protein
MIYSIAVLELSDFEGMGRKMPKGTGVDATVNNGARASHRNRKKRKVASKGSNSEIVFESGTTDEKKMARDALFAYAFPSNQDNTAGSTNKVDLTNNNVNSDDETSEEEDNDSILN